MPVLPKIPLKLSVQPGGFRDRLKQLNRTLSGSIDSWRVTVPDDLKWWYWLEFGTAGRQDADAPIKSAHSGSYEIKPTDGHKALRIGNRFAFKVEHPGIRPRLIYRGIRRELFEFIGTVNLAHALITGQTEDGLTLNEAMHEVMLYAVHAMGAQLDAAAPGTREGGRLGGRSAGDVFREEAQINADVITI
jgi:hypothetical protein